MADDYNAPDDAARVSDINKAAANLLEPVADRLPAATWDQLHDAIAAELNARDVALREVRRDRDKWFFIACENKALPRDAREHNATAERASIVSWLRLEAEICNLEYRPILLTLACEIEHSDHARSELARREDGKR